MKPQDRVEFIENGKMGTLCPTICFLTSDGDDDLSVVFDNEKTTTTLNCFDGGREAFRVVGQENARPIPRKCGAGKGADCCVFLTCGADGFSCERFSSMRDTLLFKTMNAKRNPSEPYPNCMVFSDQ